MSEFQTIIENLRQMADGVVSMFGRNCETCIHDLTSLQNSLIYVQGNVTQRKPGAPATDLLVKLLKQQGNSAEDIHNYRTITEDGRSLKSSTTFIRNSTGTIVAAFCINFDTTDFFNASQTLMPFLNDSENGGIPGSETFAHSIEDTVEALFMQGMEEVGKHPTTMSVEEKTTLIRLLEEQGTFQLKGAVEQVALLMGVTRYTVYNYLKKIRHS
jgi:predicted transcriptional regulator YheO